jgi:hypothetical protein
VAKAWKKLFDVEVSLAYITLSPDQELLNKMQDYGEVVVYKPVEGVPVGNQAKMARFFLASERYPDEVCMVNDIDTAPLSPEYFIRVLEDRKKDQLLAVGAELYVGTPHEGKFPIGEITAEGRVFKSIVNPESLSFSNYINSFIGIKQFDNKEDISVSPYVFSDESLFRVLITNQNPEVVYVSRNVDIQKYWIDRSWWAIDEDRLATNKYVLVNFLRPLNSYFDYIKPIISHIYGDESYENIFE